MSALVLAAVTFALLSMPALLEMTTACLKSASYCATVSQQEGA